MSIIPIQLTPMEIHVRADQRLAFQVITAFGAGQRLDGGASRVLSRGEDGRLLVEFHTPATGLFGRPTVYRTVEWVTLQEPQRVDFEAVEGPLSLLHDRFMLRPEGSCTRLRYESRIGMKGWILGWLVAHFYARPRLQRLMRAHLDEIKEAIEARARRSRVYPQQACPHDPALPVGKGGGK